MLKIKIFCTMCSSLTFHNNNFLSLFTIYIYFLIVLNNVTFRTRIVILGHCERWNVLNVGSSADLVMPVLWATSKYTQYHHMSSSGSSRVLGSPRGVVGPDLVQVCDGHGVLGLLLVVAHAAVLESVAPQDLVWQIWRPHLQTHNISIRKYINSWISRATTGQSEPIYCSKIIILSKPNYFLWV